MAIFAPIVRHSSSFLLQRHNSIINRTSIIQSPISMSTLTLSFSRERWQAINRQICKGLFRIWSPQKAGILSTPLKTPIPATDRIFLPFERRAEHYGLCLSRGPLPTVKTIRSRRTSTRLCPPAISSPSLSSQKMVFTC